MGDGREMEIIILKIVMLILLISEMNLGDHYTGRYSLSTEVKWFNYAELN